MLPGFMSGQMGILQPNANLIEAISVLGLEANLKLCLDAGDAASYTSGQTWSDRSGGGYNFFRGATSSVEASDPTFNGTAGRQSSSEYFLGNGSQYFTLGQANPAWVNALNAVNGTYAYLMWVYFPLISVGQILFGDDNAFSANNGVFGTVKTTNAIRAGVSDSSGFDLEDSTITVGSTGWNLVGASIKHTNAASISFIINGTTETRASGYSAGATASPATYTLQILAEGNGSTIAQANTRIGEFAMWSTQLTAAQMLSVFNATRGKYGV